MNIGVEEAGKKIRKFCDYQERNQREIRDKLYSYGLYPNEVESLLAELVEEGSVNEERYAIAFARGKFRMKQWGRVKIKYELKKQQISDYCIKIALKEIDEEEYGEVLEKLMMTKEKSLRSEKHPLIKKRKISMYLQQKGYEASLINAIMEEEKAIIKSKKSKMEK